MLIVDPIRNGFRVCFMSLSQCDDRAPPCVAIADHDRRCRASCMKWTSPLREIASIDTGVHPRRRRRVFASRHEAVACFRPVVYLRAKWPRPKLPASKHLGAMFALRMGGNPAEGALDGRMAARRRRDRLGVDAGALTAR